MYEYKKEISIIYEFGSHQLQQKVFMGGGWWHLRFGKKMHVMVLMLSLRHRRLLLGVVVPADIDRHATYGLGSYQTKLTQIYCMCDKWHKPGDTCASINYRQSIFQMWCREPILKHTHNNDTKAKEFHSKHSSGFLQNVQTHNINYIYKCIKHTRIREQYNPTDICECISHIQYAYSGCLE